ncbi:MAG: hypothetical protein V5783_11145 [Pontiella sp.]
MKAINHFQQNRPVHLARRDVYFERASELIHRQQEAYPAVITLTEYEEILFLLRVARQQAQFAIRESGKNESDEQFGSFINLLAGNVRAVLSMMNLKLTVESSEGSFFSFLGVNQASVALQAEEYQRRANDIILSLHNTLRLAEDPFGRLKSENSGSGTEEEGVRYAKARKHFTHLIDEGRHHYKIYKSVRKIAQF